MRAPYPSYAITPFPPPPVHLPGNCDGQKARPLAVSSLVAVEQVTKSINIILVIHVIFSPLCDVASTPNSLLLTSGNLIPFHIQSWCMLLSLDFLVSAACLHTAAESFTRCLSGVPCLFQFLRVLFVLKHRLAYALLLFMHRHCLLLLRFVEPLLHIIQIMLLKLFASRCLRHMHLCLFDRSSAQLLSLLSQLPVIGRRFIHLHWCNLLLLPFLSHSVFSNS